MKTEYSVNKYMKIIFYAIIAVMFVGFVCAQNLYPSERETGTERGSLLYEGTLIWEKSNGTLEQITAPGSYEVEPGLPMVISTILPEDYAENAIEIRASQQSVRFFIDGELRSQYDTTDSRPFGSNSVSRYVFCRTSRADAGKELRIELLSNSGRYSGIVNEIYCGDKADIWSYIFKTNGMEFLNGLFILFIGMITVLFSIALGIAYKTKISLTYLGWCLILGAIWLLCESKLRQLLVPNVSILASMCFIVVMLCPLPLLFYVDSIQHGRYKKLFGVIECAALVNLTVSSILQFAGIADYLDTMTAAHIILGMTVLAVLVTFVLDYRKGEIKEYLLSVIGFCAGMLGTIMEMSATYLVVSLSGIFLGTGLILLLFFTVIMTMRDVRRMEAQLDDRRKQLDMDNMDFLTGLPMRNLGEQQIEQCMQEHGGCLVFLDMDNLKKINDLYGHKSGDRSLKMIGDVIAESAEDSIACRLGGDEFLLFLPDVTRSTADELVRNIFESFRNKKEGDAEIREASLSGGLYMLGNCETSSQS